MTTTGEKQTLMRNLAKYEGTVEHMYLDTYGNVTVGVGHLLRSITDAQQLVFFKSDGKWATRDEIKIEYESIKKQPYGYAYSASYYIRHAKLKISRPHIDALTEKHIASSEFELMRLYPDFRSYPTEVRLALFDMIFNRGMTKMWCRFPRFNTAINAKDWEKAAKESNRPQLQLSRNRYVRELLENAANAESHATSGAK